MKVKDLAQMAIVAALYVAISLSSLSFIFGPIQLRIAETFNHLAIFNKKYIGAVTLGCLITNMFSSVGPLDMVIGTGQTLLMTYLSYRLTKNVKSMWVKLSISTGICTVSMFIIAIELFYVLKAPFWFTYLTLAISEFIVMAVGGVIIYLLSKRVDLKKII